MLSCFLSKICVCFLFVCLPASFCFHFFFDEVSNFHNRILTNQKPELVIMSISMSIKLYVYVIIILPKPSLKFGISLQFFKV